MTDEEARMLAALFDIVVPASPDGRLPGAGALGLQAHVERVMERMPLIRGVVEYGLSAIGDRARERDAAGFGALSAAQQAEVFSDFVASDQFFLPAFLFLAYSGYYQHPRVVTALGLEPRAPHPKGYSMEPDDWTLLDPVRARGFSRSCG